MAKRRCSSMEEEFNSDQPARAGWKKAMKNESDLGHGGNAWKKWQKAIRSWNSLEDEFF